MLSYPIAVASMWQRDRLCRHLDPRRVHIIPNESGGDATVPWSGGDGQTLRYLGHTLWYKGIDVAIEALRRLRSVRPELRLKVASSIVDRDLVRALARVPGVTVRGEVDAAEFIAGADLLLLPLRTSSGTNVYPNVLIEAMAAGAPLLTSALPAHRELLGAATATCTVENYDPAIWADRVDALLAESAARQRIGANLRARADELWEASAIDRRWTAFIAAIEAL